MRYKFELTRLMDLPIGDKSELVSLLEEYDLNGWSLIGVFEGYESYRNDYGNMSQGKYLFGIFRCPAGWPADRETELVQTTADRLKFIEKQLRCLGENLNIPMPEWPETE